MLFLFFSEESFESLQMRDMISELQSAIKVERQQSLAWMEKHNKVYLLPHFKGLSINDVTFEGVVGTTK